MILRSVRLFQFNQFILLRTRIYNSFRYTENYLLI